MEQHNDEVLAGKLAFTARRSKSAREARAPFTPTQLVVQFGAITLSTSPIFRPRRAN
jgi:hypothetical protein